MRAIVGHLQYNIRSENQLFYRDFFDFLGWRTLHDEETMLGVGTPESASLWFASFATNDAPNDYDGVGVNHLGFHVSSIAEVDEAAAWLTARGVELLFGTPRHHEAFSDEKNTYYQIMFESPDRLLFEIVYMGPRA